MTQLEENASGQEHSTENPESSMATILAADQGEYHAIVLHDYPDPDAIAAACAHKLLNTRSSPRSA